MGSRSEVLKQFRTFDRDGNGMIALSELRAVLHALDKKHWNDTVTDRLFRVIDTNQDSMISYDEFVAWAFGNEGTQTKDLKAFHSAAASATTPKSECALRCMDGFLRNEREGQDTKKIVAGVGCTGIHDSGILTESHVAQRNITEDARNTTEQTVVKQEMASEINVSLAALSSEISQSLPMGTSATDMTSVAAASAKALQACVFALCTGISEDDSGWFLEAMEIEAERIGAVLHVMRPKYDERDSTLYRRNRMRRGKPWPGGTAWGDMAGMTEHQIIGYLDDSRDWNSGSLTEAIRCFQSYFIGTEPPPGTKPQWLIIFCGEPTSEVSNTSIPGKWALVLDLVNMLSTSRDGWLCFYPPNGDRIGFTSKTNRILFVARGPTGVPMSIQEQIPLNGRVEASVAHPIVTVLRSADDKLAVVCTGMDGDEFVVPCVNSANVLVGVFRPLLAEQLGCEPRAVFMVNAAGCILDNDDSPVFESQ